MQNDAFADTPWYLAQLKPNGLALALRNLEHQRFKTFAPCELRTQRRPGKFVTKQTPVFPGYVFVQIGDDSCGIRAINSTRGISRLVALGPEPCTVPRDVMAALFARYGNEADTTPKAEFRPGDNIDILEGPFADFTARIEALAPHDRVIVLLDLMGRTSRVTLEMRHVRRTSP